MKFFISISCIIFQKLVDYSNPHESLNEAYFLLSFFFFLPYTYIEDNHTRLINMTLLFELNYNIRMP